MPLEYWWERSYETVCMAVGEKWKLYSGLFVLLKQRMRLSRYETRRLLNKVFISFKQMVRGHVPSFV